MARDQHLPYIICHPAKDLKWKRLSLQASLERD
jgi:hypothetical protein